MIDMEQANKVIERREQEARDKAIQEDAANIEHRRTMAATSQQMTAAQERARAARAAAHERARTAARAEKDAVTAATHEAETIDFRVGSLRADRAEIEKKISRCQAPPADSYPTESELDAWRQRHGQLTEEAQRLHALIGVETVRHSAALQKQWDQEAIFERAKEAELAARNEL